MKKRYLLFLPLFLMFFCIDMSEVKAAGIMCAYKNQCNYKILTAAQTSKVPVGTQFKVDLTYGLNFNCTGTNCKLEGKGYIKTWKEGEQDRSKEEGDLISLKNGDIFSKKNVASIEGNFGFNSRNPQPSKCPDNVTISTITYDGLEKHKFDSIELKKRTSSQEFCSLNKVADATYSAIEDSDFDENIKRNSKGEIGFKINNPNHPEDSSSENVDDLVNSVRAANPKGKNPYDTNSNLNSSDELYCSVVLGDGVVDILRTIFMVIMIVGLLILIFSMSGDFIKAITSGDADAMSQAFKKSKTRIFAVIILLILPMLVNFMIDFINDNARIEEGNFKIGNVSECNITN